MKRRYIWKGKKYTCFCHSINQFVIAKVLGMEPGFDTDTRRVECSRQNTCVCNIAGQTCIMCKHEILSPVSDVNMLGNFPKKSKTGA